MTDMDRTTSRFSRRQALIAAGASAVTLAPVYAGRAATAAPPLGFRHARETGDGVDIRFVTGGRGEPLLLHGWPVTSYA